MKDVFISYKAEEFDEANWVKSVLENNGISCWMAPSCIPGGSSYAVEIPHAIKAAKVLVLILSSKAQASPWVSREIDLALNEGKVVLPFMLENCALKDDFNFYLTNVQRYTAYENKVAAMEKMIREIKAIIGVSENQEEAEEAELVAEVSVKEPVQPKVDNTKTIDVKQKAKYAKYSIVSFIIALISLIPVLDILVIAAWIFAFLGIKNVAETSLKGKKLILAAHILSCISLFIALIPLAAIGVVLAIIIDVLVTVFFVKKYKKI